MLKTRILEIEWVEWKLCIKDYNTPKTIGPKCHKIITGKEIFFHFQYYDYDKYLHTLNLKWDSHNNNRENCPYMGSFQHLRGSTPEWQPYKSL